MRWVHWSYRVILFLGLISLLSTPAGAAHFVNEDTHTVSENVELSVNTAVQCDPAAIGSDTCEDAELAEYDATYLVAPDAGEQNGDPVVVKYHYAGEAGVTITGTGSAVGWLGGIIPETIREGEYSNEVQQIQSPARIVLHSGGSQAVRFSYGPASVSTSGESINPERAGMFTAKIGDTIEFELGAVSEVYAEAPGISEAFSNANMGAELELPPSAVPTMGEWGMMISSLLMATLALWAIRKKRILGCTQKKV